MLTTLHTNDCPSTVARLLDMGIPPFLVSSALSLILAQRLGRKICKDCKQPYEADEESLVPYGHVPQGLGKVQLYKGKGCQVCSFTGMKGRVAIYEVMPINEQLRELILRNAPTAEIRDIALSRRHEDPPPERAAEGPRRRHHRRGSPPGDRQLARRQLVPRSTVSGGGCCPLPRGHHEARVR